jgi:hypothetical protein
VIGPPGKNQQKNTKHKRKKEKKEKNHLKKGEKSLLLDIS